MDKSHEEKLAKPVIDYALKTIENAKTESQKVLITIGTSNEKLSQILEEYNFKQIEKNLYLGLKMKEGV